MEGSESSEGADGLRDRKRAQARAATLDAAVTLFEKHGFEEVTVADICAAAQIAPRTFFRYFPSKDDLLAEPSRDMAVRAEAAIRAAPDDADDAAVLTAALLEIGEYVVAHRDRLKVFFKVAEQSTSVRAHPFLRLSDRERQLAERLARRDGSATPDWRTRLMVARAVAGFRIWLDDELAQDLPDPLAHLAEILAEQ